MAFHVEKERRLLDVGAGVIERVEVGRGRGNRLPCWWAVDRLLVFLAEHLWEDRILGHAADLLVGRPDVAEENVVAVAVFSERFDRQVQVDPPSQGVGDDERWGCEVVGLGRVD